jgi:AcrR family transcriptional regulator
MDKQRIIQESLKLFMQYGIRSVSMDDVSRKLGISKKTLYNHIDSKKELVGLSVQCQQHEECQMMEKIMTETSDALEATVKIGRYIINLVANLKPGTIYDMQKYYPQIHDSWEAKHSDHIRENLIKNLKLGIEQGCYRPEIDIEVIARLYVGKVKLIMNERVFPSNQFNHAHVVRENFIYHLHGILTPKGLERMYKEDLITKKLEA